MTTLTPGIRTLSTILASISGLGVRTISSSLFPATLTEDDALDLARALSPVFFFGMWEGAILSYVLRESTTIATGLLVGLGLRMIADHLTKPDARKFITTLLGITLGLLVTDMLTGLLTEGTWWTEDDEKDLQDSWMRRRRRQIRKYRKESENLSQNGQFIRTVDDPLSMFPEDVLSIRSSQDEHVDEVVALKRRASAAAGHSRRVQEERKWAWSQGNPARAFQLGWEIRRYQLLAEELEQRAKEKEEELKAGKRTESEIHLVGLTVREAIDTVEARIREAQRRGETRVRIFVDDKTYAPGLKHELVNRIQDLSHNMEEERSQSDGKVLVVSLDDHAQSGTHIRSSHNGSA